MKLGCITNLRTLARATAFPPLEGVEVNLHFNSQSSINSVCFAAPFNFRHAVSMQRTDVAI
jgi:hypothetical protein